MAWHRGVGLAAASALWVGLSAALPSSCVAASATAPSRIAPADEIRALAALDTANDPQGALRRIDAALARVRRDRSIRPTDILLVEVTRGEALFWLRRYAEALAVFRHFDRAMTALAAPMTPRWAEVVNDIGSAYSSLGLLDEAARYKQRAMDLSARLAGTDSTEYASALYGLALVDYRRGLAREAIPRIVQAVAIGREAAARTGRNLELPAIAGITLSSLELQAGDSATAVSAARSAALWADARLGDRHRLTLAALNQLGAALNDAGLYGQATPILRRTLDLQARTLPEGHTDIAYTLNALAFALEHAGYPEEALPFYQRSAAIFETLPPSQQPMSGANVFGQIGRISARKGKADEAIASYRKALGLARRNARSPEDLEVLWAEVNLAVALVGRGDLDPAQALLDHAVSAYARQADPGHPDRVAASAWRGAIDGLRGDRAGGLAQVDAAIAPLRLRLLDRATVRSDAVRIRAEAADLFVLQARVAVAAGDMATAFDALQMAGMGDLQTGSAPLDMIRDAHGGEASAAVGDYLAASTRLQDLRKQRDRALGLGDRATLAQMDRDIPEAKAVLRAQDARLSGLIPGYAALTGFAPTSLVRARAGLRGREAMVLYGQDNQGLLVMAVTRKGVTAMSVPVAPAHLSDLQHRVRASIEQGLLMEGQAPFDRPAAFDLYRLLFPKPVAQAIKGARDIRVLAPGMLAALPFDALVTAPPAGDDADSDALRDTAWLVRRHAVSVMINAAPAKGGYRQRKRGFVGIGALRPGAWAAQAAQEGDPARTAAAALPELPGATGELQALAARIGGEHRLVIGDAATEAAVKAAPLAQAGVIAFATHGLVGGAIRNLVEPALVLAPGEGTGEDGLLTASEIAQLRLDADWVILSACDTSAGESENAPAYSGLARAFVVAGARALLLSHWPVRDDVTARLTVDTVKAARGSVSRAEALRRAQTAVLKDRALTGSSHPATWAPFVLVGD